MTNEYLCLIRKFLLVLWRGFDFVNCFLFFRIREFLNQFVARFGNLLENCQFVIRNFISCHGSIGVSNFLVSMGPNLQNKLWHLKINHLRFDTWNKKSGRYSRDDTIWGMRIYGNIGLRFTMILHLLLRNMLTTFL